MNCSQIKMKESSSDLFGGEYFSSPCHHRVLKPPGGGAHDIFGSAEMEKPNVVVTRKSSSQSSINLSEELEQQIVNGGTSFGAGSENGSAKQGSCNERLFGPPLTDDNQLPKLNGNAATEVKEEIAVVDGPAQMNGNGGIYKVNGGPAQPPAETFVGRKRVPPGGYSSGLW